MKRLIVIFFASFFLTLMVLHHHFIAYAHAEEQPSTQQIAQEQQFPDVEPDAWFYPYVMELAEDGIVQGYPDGRFGAWDPVNRAELAKIIVLLRSELRGHWLKDSIAEIILVLATVFGWMYLVAQLKDLKTPQQPQQTSQATSAPPQKTVPEDDAAIEKNLKSNWWV